MKKIYFLLIVLFFVMQYAAGQSSFGIQAGINFANQHKTFTTTINPATQVAKTKTLLGYQAGVFGKVKLNTAWTIAAEVNYSLIGSKTFYTTEEQILNPDGKDHYYNDKIGYIEIPLTIQYHIFKMYFGAGPGIAIKVFSKISNFENRSYNTPYYKTLDANGNLLAGYSFSKSLDVNVRYSYGLLYVYEANNYTSVKNRFLTVSLLYNLK